jgi:pre-rRNA-processing protein TSR3
LLIDDHNLNHSGALLLLLLLINNRVKAHVLMLNQDDPKKCTALRMVKLGLAIRTNSIKHYMIVLNPFSKYVLYKDDVKIARSICVIDCSWNKAERILQFRKFLHLGIARRMPALLAGNPVNYSRLGKLSTVEALGGCYYIIGYKTLAFQILNKFKWGHTFLDLNLNILEDYSKARNPDEIIKLENEYFGISHGESSYKVTASENLKI